jgi:polyisoprenoid-binding protein YceI
MVAATIVVCSSSPGGATRQQVDTERSTFTVKVGKTGFFRAFADNHVIRASVKEGYLDEENPATVQVLIDANQLRVLDTGLSPHDREQVQVRMLGPDVLDVNRFPEIRFRSTGADHIGSGGWVVRGQLTLHGETRPVTAKVNRAREHYEGSVVLKQTDFGIKPVTIAGGTVKVKDELTIEFDIVARSPSRPDR